MIIQFHPTTEKHLLQLLKIYNHYVEHSPATYHIHPLTIDEMQSKVFFEKPKYKTYTITSQIDGIIGYCSLTPYSTKGGYSGTAEISIYLKPNHTKQGIGKKAIELLENEAKKNKIRVLIAAANTENTASAKLFKKCGYEQCAYFKQVGEKFGRILDDVHFQKIIG